ncbi:PASTA domain-containing protein [Pseudonocardia sp. CA-107938]|uniref:PASTA domain-containing protein n=1 Tax=Pseudonocardia sp. CA-107938 TaxID=3240021 RepID=UPI003D8FE78C
MEHREKVLVPALVGLDMIDATRLAAAAGVALDPITGPARSGEVTGQQPLAGTKVDPGSAVQITVDESGGGGGGGSALVPPPVPVGPAGAKDTAGV